MQTKDSLIVMGVLIAPCFYTDVVAVLLHSLVGSACGFPRSHLRDNDGARGGAVPDRERYELGPSSPRKPDPAACPMATYTNRESTTTAALGPDDATAQGCLESGLAVELINTLHRGQV